MKLERLFEMVYLLLYRKQMTAKELAHYFEVSPRTIYRDVDSLSLAGIPIYSTKGSGGGIRLTDSFVLDRSVFSKEEQEQMVLALENLMLTGMDSQPLLNKIKGVFQDIGENWLEIDFSYWGDNDTLQEKFDLLKNAILQKRAIKFHYYNAKGETSNRVVLPMRLIFKGQDWYLYAYCLNREDNRLFKLRRIQEPQLEHYSGKWPQKPTKTVVEKEFKGAQWENVVLKFHPQIAYQMYDEFLPNQIEKQDDGTFLVNMELPKDNWIYNYVLSYGDMVEVVRPKEIRDELIARLNKMQKTYSD